MCKLYVKVEFRMQLFSKIKRWTALLDKYFITTTYSNASIKSLVYIHI